MRGPAAAVTAPDWTFGLPLVEGHREWLGAREGERGIERVWKSGRKDTAPWLPPSRLPLLYPGSGKKPPLVFEITRDTMIPPQETGEVYRRFPTDVGPGRIKAFLCVHG